MRIHLLLNVKEPIQPKRFKRSLFLLDETVRESFEGDKVERMLKSSQNIGSMMKYKMGI